MAINEKPTGPFVDIGSPSKAPEATATAMRAYDPVCFIDDDGKAYL